MRSCGKMYELVQIVVHKLEGDKNNFNSNNMTML